ncbi:MAG: hypothetical protein A3H98_05755 [Bacteroidetes bacterium RIFCSPLOWO2_02_FULL_36_8]|nr:MAG: hypothetical protein A3H98_05755 [Bacteroidetes bacterium RIFCSPLOWO2_02_FULL_36_8]OFY70104.1 MAG: hypothetical protein A3G23_11740 [Bacteroidetes bacterium RIFCSPLOWO2_12_FULL_37_12]
MNRSVFFVSLSIILLWVISSFIFVHNSLPSDGSYDIGIPFTFIKLWVSQLDDHIKYKFMGFNLVIDLIVVSLIIFLINKIIQKIFLKKLK